MQLCVYVAGITILLSLSVFQLIVAEMVPSTSMAVPLVGRVIGHDVIRLHYVIYNSPVPVIHYTLNGQYRGR